MATRDETGFEVRYNRRPDGKVDSVDAGGRRVATYEYKETTGELSAIVHGNNARTEISRTPGGLTKEIRVKGPGGSLLYEEINTFNELGLKTATTDS